MADLLGWRRQWDRAQEVNLRSVFLASKAAIPHMIEAGRGSIINTSSVSIAKPAHSSVAGTVDCR